MIGRAARSRHSPGMKRWLPGLLALNSKRSGLATLSALTMTCVLGLSACGPTAGTRILDDDFARGKEGWNAWRSDLEVVPEGQDGSQALRWDSTVKKRFIFIAKSELDPSQFAGQAGVRVTIRSNLRGPLLFHLNEVGGATYQFASHGQPVGPDWQEVIVPFDAFELEADGNDANGRLDLDQIAEFWIVDMAGYYQTDLKGKRTVWLDRIELVSDFGTATALARGDRGGEVIPSGPRGGPMDLKSDPSVLRDGDRYKMWFGGSPAGNGHQFFYAESRDGRQWDVRNEPVLRLGAKGAWDAGDLETPTVVRASDGFHMWYCAWEEKETNDNWSPKTALRIGHATSKDGIHWTKDPRNPVIGLGNRKRNDWNWAAAAEPTVVTSRRNGRDFFEMWYVGANLIEGKAHFHIGYATSWDGSHWQEHADNPVIASTPSGREEEYVGYFTPEVVKDGSEYLLFYTTDTFNNQPVGPIRLARSANGTNWRMDGRALVSKGAGNSWRNTGVFGATVVVEPEGYRLWYTGFAITTRLLFGIGYEELSRPAVAARAGE